MRLKKSGHLKRFLVLFRQVRAGVNKMPGNGEFQEINRLWKLFLFYQLTVYFPNHKSGENVRG
jgi:hypothetical protein